MTIAPSRTTWPIAYGGQYEGSRIPSPIPTVKQLDPSKVESEDILRINFGPNHPSTHGVLRLIIDLHGEEVVGLDAVIGYLHTGFEKTMEQKTWWKGVTYSPLRSTISRSTPCVDGWFGPKLICMTSSLSRSDSSTRRIVGTGDGMREPS